MVHISEMPGHPVSPYPTRQAAPPPCFCIAGHHRSGTSMIAAMLQSAGLDIGSRLMGAYEGNLRGHFEDLDFYDFHVAVLTALGLGTEGYVLEPSLRVDEEFTARAQALVQARRETGRPWGWKDPRSTLFLNFWAELIPEARFLLLFRAPWEVADSMFRRGDAAFRQEPSLIVKVWLIYNRAMMDFYARFPQRCVLVESHAAAIAPHRLIEAVAAKFGDKFGPVEDLFDKDLFRHDSMTHPRWVFEHFYPEAVELYAELRAGATLSFSAPQEPATSSSEGANADQWPLKHWLDCRVLEKSIEATRSELEQARAEINRLQGELVQGERDKTAVRPAAGHMSTLFVDSGAGFRAEEAFQFPMEAPGEFLANFDLTVARPARALRWDPVEMRTCRVWLSEITWQTNGQTHSLDLATLNGNGVEESPGAFRFDTLDPMLVVPVHGPVQRLTIRGRCEVDDLLTSMRRIETLLQSTAAHLGAREQFLNELEGRHGRVQHQVATLQAQMGGLESQLAAAAQEQLSARVALQQCEEDRALLARHVRFYDREREALLAELQALEEDRAQLVAHLAGYENERARFGVCLRAAEQTRLRHAVDLQAAVERARRAEGGASPVSAAGESPRLANPGDHPEGAVAA
jgi:Sulfotransferase family